MAVVGLAQQEGTMNKAGLPKTPGRGLSVVQRLFKARSRYKNHERQELRLIHDHTYISYHHSYLTATKHTLSKILDRPPLVNLPRLRPLVHYLFRSTIAPSICPSIITITPKQLIHSTLPICDTYRAAHCLKEEENKSIISNIDVEKWSMY